MFESEGSAPRDPAAPQDARPGPSDREIVQQVEAELSGQRANSSVGVFIAFALSCAACLGVFGMVLGRARSLAPTPAPSVTPLVVAQPTPVAAFAWNYGFEEGQSRTRRSGKKMLVAFYADWCPSCRWMDANVYGRPEVASQAAGVEMVKVNSDARPDLARRYNIRVLPSFVWMTAEGSETARDEGSLPAPQFAELMRVNR